MCGVCSSICRTADTTLSLPYVSCNHCILSWHQLSSCPLSSIRFISSNVPVSNTRIALTWFLPILRVMPAVLMRWLIASLREWIPSGNSMSSLFRWVRLSSAFLGWIVRSIWADIPVSAPFAFSKCSTAYPIVVLNYLVLSLGWWFSSGFQKGLPLCSLVIFSRGV